MTIPITMLGGLPASTFLEMLNDSTMKISFSHLGEDIIVFNLLAGSVKKIQGGFYVDIGAHHPRQYSNTRILTLFGWRGINIDANLESIAAFMKDRPNDINICCGVGKAEEYLPFYRFANSEVSTFSAEVANTWREKNGWHHVDTRTVQVKPINTILKESLPADTKIDYMDIDVEGMDREIVESLDLNIYRPSVLTVELHDADKLNLAEDKTVTRLRQSGYNLIACNVHTYAFLHEEYQ